VEHGGPDGCASYGSTFQALGARIFERRGCTAETCHGGAVSGGLDLRSSAAYASLNDASKGSALRRVEPGSPDRSFLYLKLKAATQPGSVQVSGSPMPSGAAPLSENELEAVRVWIAAGAPSTGSVGDPRYDRGSADYVEGLLNVCLPPAEPVAIPPLEPPPAEKGIQLEMPTYAMAAHSEWEGCFASYYDFTDRVPARFQTADKTQFYVNGTQIRQDAASHHLVIMHSGFGTEKLGEASYGPWTCRGGAMAGQACDPARLDGCANGGLCASESKAAGACIGFGPPGSTINPGEGGLGTALQAQLVVEPVDGVYRKVPMKGIVYWNLHAFNLTTTSSTLHARLNLLYTDDLRFEETHISYPGNGFAGIPPFTKKDVCSTYTAPQGSKMIRLTSHTHRRGQYFWVNDPAGKRFYESFYYYDPTYLAFNPPIAFGSADEAERTLTFCATFNNGIKDDGSPDLDLVTRRSRLPPYSRDAAGSQPRRLRGRKNHIAMLGRRRQRELRLVAGSRDGMCDALPIMNGETTENEMFFMIPDLIMPAAISSK
jgi:hypothetical protein